MLSMHKWLLGTLAAAGLVLGVATIPARAADEATGKGSISGTVVDKDGKGVADVKVNLMKPPQGRGNRGGGGGGGAPPAAGAGEKKEGQSALNRDAIGLQAQGGGRNRPQPIQTATTDKDGKFTMSDVPSGSYMVGVFDNDKKIYGRKPVTVEDGKTATVEIATSDTPPQRGGRGGGGGGKNGGAKNGGGNGQ